LPINDPASFGKLIDARTKAVYCESVGNPLGNVTDIAALAAVAHAHGVPLIVDNTVPSPYLCRPFEHGADIVVHSLTKYLGGHGTTIGGIIVDSGKFPWARTQSALQAPERARCELPRRGLHRGAGRRCLHWPRPRSAAAQHGCGAEPMNAFQILQGIETLPLRMDRICDNALRVAKHLQTHPKVSWVNYAGLSDHADHGLVKKYMGGRASGIISFGLKASDSLEAGARFQDALQAVHPPGQHWRRQVPGLPPCHHHPPPAQRRRVGQGRRQA
jgi:O-acetylhomoserine (thiol)-lyase